MQRLDHLLVLFVTELMSWPMLLLHRKHPTGVGELWVVGLQ